MCTRVQCCVPYLASGTQYERLLLVTLLIPHSNTFRYVSAHGGCMFKGIIEPLYTSVLKLSKSALPFRYGHEIKICIER